MRLSLQASAPDVLQQTISLCQSVQGIVALAHRSYEAAEGIDLVLPGVSAVLINLSYGDLDGCVILRLDDAVGCAALAGDVTEFCQFHASLYLLSHRSLGNPTGQRVLPCRSPCWRFVDGGFVR
jgi:hypothetical protein